MRIDLGDVTREVREKKTDLDLPDPITPIVNSLYRPRLEFVRFLEGVVRSNLSGVEEGEVSENPAKEEELQQVPQQIPLLAKSLSGFSPVRTKLSGEWNCNYHMEDVASLSPEQANVLLFGIDWLGERDRWYFHAPMTLEVTLSYPLSVEVRVRIAPPRRAMPLPGASLFEGMDSKDDFPVGGEEFNSFGLFLLAVAKEYERIYSDKKKHGVWGHGIGDLYFEQVRVGKDGSAFVSIGS